MPKNYSYRELQGRIDLISQVCTYYANNWYHIQLLLDVTSTVYAVGDLVDVKDREQGAWLEGKIVRIVLDPKVNYENEQNKEDLNSSLDNKNDLENKPPSNISEQSNTQKIGIAKYFTKQTNGKRLSKDFKVKTVKVTAENVLYKVQLDDE